MMNQDTGEQRQQRLANFSFPALASNFFSVFGEGVYRFGLNWFLVSTYGDARLLGWLTAFGFLVYLANDIYVGAVLDRFNRKHVLVLADLFGAAGLIILSIFLNPTDPQVWLLFMLTFIMNIDISYAYPAGRAILTDVIKKKALAKFNAWISAAFSAGQALGPLVGGLLLQMKWIDLRTFMLIYGGMVLMTALINMAIKAFPEEVTAEPEPFIQSLKSGFRYVYNQPVLFESVLLTVWSNACFEGFIVAMPFLIQESFHGSAGVYSTALTLAATAGILAGIVLAHFPQVNNLKTLYWDFYALGLVLVGAAFVNQLWALIAAIILNGYIRAAFVVKINTVRQQESAPAYLGRVFGVSFFATDACVPIVTVLLGYLVSQLGVTLLLWLGLSMLIGTLLIKCWCAKRRQAMDMHF